MAKYNITIEDMGNDVVKIVTNPPAGPFVKMIDDHVRRNTAPDLTPAEEIFMQFLTACKKRRDAPKAGKLILPYN